MKLVSEVLLELSPADAKKLKIEDGEYVKVSSRRGKIHVNAKVTNRPACPESATLVQCL
jgi:anaerobic selenocysteine-containing dehydrogenase